MPFVSPNNLLVSTINGTGAAIESVYVLIFLIFASKKEKGKILGLLTLILSVFAVVAFVSLFALHGKHRKLFCGIAATVFSIVMYGSPLTIIVSCLLSILYLLRISSSWVYSDKSKAEKSDQFFHGYHTNVKFCYFDSRESG